MKGITLLTCTILALAFSSRAAPLPPADSFRLIIEDVIQSSACRVVKLKVETRSTAEMMALRCDDGSGGSVILAPTLKGKAREGTMILASMLCESNSVCHVTTMLQSRPGGGTSASGHGSYDLAPDAKLESVVVVTATNGHYKLDHPLVIGKRNGETMRLVVGSWNWEQVSQKK